MPPRLLGQLAPALRAGFIRAGETLDGLTSDEQLGVASLQWSS